MSGNERQISSVSFGDQLIGSMICLSGASHSEDKSRIVCPLSASGFVVYGPYLLADPGLYEAELGVVFPNGGPLRSVVVEIYGSGIIFASRSLNYTSSSFRLTAYVDRRTSLEVRVSSASNDFVINSIIIHKKDDRSDGAPADVRNISHERLISVIQGHGISQYYDVDLGALFNDPRFQIFTFSDISSRHDLLRAAGVEPAILEKFKSDNLGRPSPEDRIANGHPPVSNTFQLEIASTGEWTIPAFDGSGTMTCRSSIPIMAQSDAVVSVVYEFLEGDTVLIGASSSWAGMISFIWLVEKNIIIYEDSYWSDWRPYFKIISSYINIIINNTSLVRAYRASEKSRGVMLGFINNLGHYFWNDLSGCERLIRHGASHSVDTAITRTGAWLHPRACFEDKLAANYVDVSSADLFNYVISHNLFVVRPTATLIDRPFASRLCSTAETEFSRNSHDRYIDAKAIADDYFIVFANVRTHNKMWIEQVDGIYAAAKLISESQSKPVAIYIDGFRDCAGVMQEIEKKVSGFARVIDGLNVKIEETIYWASQTSFFIAAIGSGLTLVTWLADKPGFCHGDARHLEQQAFWGKVSDATSKVVWARNEDVRDEEDRFYSNYQLSPDTILNVLRSDFGFLGSRPHEA